MASIPSIRSIRSSVQSSVPSQKQVVEHARRAQGRLTRAFAGSRPEDVFIQAVAGAVGCSVGLRLLRAPGIGTLLASWGPVAVFGFLYHRALSHTRR